jgi:uncharacterized protein YbjT (DUF2867 family)
MGQLCDLRQKSATALQFDMQLDMQSDVKKGTSMIAVTGAAGKTGLAIIQAVAQRKVPLAALIHKTSDQAKTIAAGATTSVVGSVADAAALRVLLQGAAGLYHICPNMHPDEEKIGATVLACALDAGIEHFVYHSVLHPQTAAMPHHWQKMLVEDRIFASGIPFTILQPTAYMQNLLPYWPTIRQTGNYAVPYPVSTRLAMVDLRDVAEVAARVLVEPGHAGAIYELVGSAPLTQSEVAAKIAAAWGHPVTAAEVALEQWEAQVRSSGLHDYGVECLRKMFTYYAKMGLVGNSNVLRWLLGREAASLEAFVAEMVLT